MLTKDQNELLTRVDSAMLLIVVLDMVTKPFS